MRTRLTKHGQERLFERVLRKAQDKSRENAIVFIQKVLAKGIITANDAHQTLVLYAENLYIFKKDLEQLVFITVKTCKEHHLGIYIRGSKNIFTTKNNFALCA